MKTRSFEDIQKILSENSITNGDDGASFQFMKGSSGKIDFKSNPKYRFFRELEAIVYEGKDADDYRFNFHLPTHIEGVQKVIPYWEIHYYNEGFDIEFGGNTDDWFSQRESNEKHFYFTFASDVRGMISDIVDPSLPILEMGENPNRLVVKKDYSGQANSQKNEKINVWIIDDSNDNLDYFKTLIPKEIWECLSKKDKGFNFKPSELPKVLFLSNGCKFNAKTENVESIVCLDRFTNLQSSEVNFDDDDNQLLKIKGNTFLNRSAFVSLSRYGEKNLPKAYLGKNTIFGKDSSVKSIYIEDNVVIGDNVDIDLLTELRENSIITQGVKISENQKILFGQIITTKPPLLLQLLKDDRGFLSQDFYRRSKTADLIKSN